MIQFSILLFIMMKKTFDLIISADDIYRVDSSIIENMHGCWNKQMTVKGFIVNIDLFDFLRVSVSISSWTFAVNN